MSLSIHLVKTLVSTMILAGYLLFIYPNQAAILGHPPSPGEFLAIALILVVIPIIVTQLVIRGIRNSE